MEKDRMKDIFRSKLSDHQSVLNTEEGWSELEAMLPKKKRRRVFIILLLIGVAGSLFTLQFLRDKNVPTESFTHAYEEALPSKPYSHQKEDLSSINVEDNKPLEEEEDKATLRISSLSPLSVIEVKSKSIDKTIDYLNYGHSQSAKKERAVVGLNIISLEKSAATTISKTLESRVLSKGTVPNQQNLLSTKHIDYQTDRGDSNTSNGEVTAESKDQPYFTNDILTTSKVLPLLFINPLPLNDIQEITLLYNTEFNPILMSIEKDDALYEVPEENENTRNKKWSIGLSAGTGLWESGIKSSSSTHDKYKSTLTPLETIQVNANIDYRLTQSLSIRSGIEYQLLKEVFRYKNEEDITRQVDIVAVIKVNTITGDSTSVIESHTQTGRSNRSVQHFNTYTNWSIPLSISYKIQTGRWALAPSIGVLFNLSSMKKGKEINDNTILQSETSTYYKKQLGLSFTLGSELRFSLTQTTDLFLNPELRVSTNSWTKPTDLSLKPKMLLLNLGIMKHL